MKRPATYEEDFTDEVPENPFEYIPLKKVPRPPIDPTTQAVNNDHFDKILAYQGVNTQIRRFKG